MSTAVATNATTATTSAAPAGADGQAKVLEVVKKVTTIATLPEVTAKIITTVEDRNSSASQLHKIVAHDPALVTRILKVVNSAFYGLPGQIGSVERAIVLLGLNAVKNIAVAASLGQLFRGAKLCEGFTAKDLWTHCIAVGVAARDLAKQLKLPIADEAFLAGMIHDVGILISLQLYPDQIRRVCETAKANAGASDTGGANSFCDLERKVVGFDHQQLGMALAEQWRFPRSCQLVAGFHHAPGLLSDQNRTLVTLIHVADTICCQSKHGFNLTAIHQKLDASLLRDLKLEDFVVTQTAAKLDTLVSDAASLLA